ncbi:hypothetical protein [uncultured Imperialibacter sp.]|uniref:tetratricopeptide repeat protein n=1 Tax=uncultured Imperialibacter sp. TaxID=1672639 RepID=UPI0030D886E7|tara:strand:+ start:174 stop:917 length:744 start_codon:yes stop_codon:yes gene_type:complete
MNNLQSWHIKIFFCFFVSTFLTPEYSSAQSVSADLLKADSLFELKKYTESFDEYQLVFEAGMASPQMLMKMAFIKEGLDEYPEALFYLTKYYDLTHNNLVLKKINEIAEKQGLLGYDVTDADFIMSWYSLYYDLILTVVMSVIFVLLLLQVYRFLKKKNFSTGLMTWQLVFGLSLVVVVNYPLSKPEAIIVEPATYLMKGPSAGAPMLEIVSQGHKVKVLDAGQIWTKILWHDAEVYVRSGSLKRLG